MSVPRFVRCMRLLGWLGLCPVLAAPLHAQATQPSAVEVGQIIDASLDAVLPPGTMTAEVLAERGLRLDVEATLAGFGLGNPAARAGLIITRDYTPGTDSLLADCDQMGSGSCARLGRSVYVHVERLAAASDQVAVWVHVRWASPGSPRTFLTGESTELFLSRSVDGRWTVVRVGRKAIS